MITASSSIAIVLTAAVRPSVQGPVAITDPEIRLGQYARAINDWYRAAQARDWQITVVETTGSAQDLSSRCVGKVRILQYEPTESARTRGKGAVEADALDWLLDEIADDLDPSTSIFKCTGRLRVRNYANVVSKLGANNVRVRSTLDGSWADTRLFAGTARVWDTYLRGMAADVDDATGSYLERVLARRIHLILSAGVGSVERFAQRPRFDGMSGTSGKTYGGRVESLREAFFNPIERMLRDYASRKKI